MNERPTFLLKLEIQQGIDSIKAVRWGLKKLQRLGLRCISIEQTNSVITNKGETHEQDDG